MFEISSLRYRFKNAMDALQAAVAFEAATTEFYDYDIRYSVGETEGWVVEVRAAHVDGVGQSGVLGNLRPVEQMELA